MVGEVHLILTWFSLHGDPCREMYPTCSCFQPCDWAKFVDLASASEVISLGGAGLRAPQIRELRI